MNQSLRDEVAQLHARICSGLADPNRILLLYALSDRPRSVSDLAAQLEAAQPSVSRHLKILRDCGLVTAERDGQSVIYFLTDDRVIGALDLLRAVLADQLENQGILAPRARV